MSYKDFIVTKEDGVAVVTINRPDKGNSWTQATYEEMARLQQDLHYDEEIKVIVLTGAGEKFFCAGADLSLISSLNPEFIALNLPRFQAINTGWEKHIKPVIVAIQGIVVGSGLELALAGNIRVSTPEATFAINEVKLGLNPDMGGTQRLVRTVGRSQAMRLILTGETIDSSEALRIGLIDMVFEKEVFMPKVIKLARVIAQNPPLAVRYAKKAINIAQDVDINTGLLIEEMGSTYCVSTDAMQAIMTKLKK